MTDEPIDLSNTKHIEALLVGDRNDDGTVTVAMTITADLQRVADTTVLIPGAALAQLVEMAKSYGDAAYADPVAAAQYEQVFEQFVEIPNDLDGAEL